MRALSLRGYATLIGAPANAVDAKPSDRAGQKITVTALLPHGVLVVFESFVILESLVIATICVWIRGTA